MTDSERAATHEIKVLPKRAADDGAAFPHAAKPMTRSAPRAVAHAPDAQTTVPLRNNAVFVALYESHIGFVWRTLRRLGVADDALADAAQEVFVVVHRRLADFQGLSTARTWLFGIVRRVAGDHRRRRRRKAPGVELELDSLPDLSQSDPYDSTERAERVERLHALLLSLDEDKREVLILADLEQMSAPEIAEATGITLNTVYSRLRAARRDFSEALALRAGGRSAP